MESNFDLRNMPLSERIREYGPIKAAAITVDDVVRRTLTGIDIAELRAVLRGDEPLSRPNPRLTPHADSFWFHIRPGYYNEAVTGVYPTFKLGWLSTFFFGLEFVTGLFLMVF